jgi:hypothetical protein
MMVVQTPARVEYLTTIRALMLKLISMIVPLMPPFSDR